MRIRDWETDLSPNARRVMRELGGFGPITDDSQRTVKGYTYDEDGIGCKTYYTSGDLRGIADACLDVADWLDNRANGVRS